MMDYASLVSKTPLCQKYWKQKWSERHHKFSIQDNKIVAIKYGSLRDGPLVLIGGGGGGGGGYLLHKKIVRKL